MYEFNKQKYRSVLKLFKNNGYDIIRFCDIDACTSDKRLVLRHDVDFSLDYALDMAKIEAEDGVKSTYFVMLYSAFYSAFNAKNGDILKRLTDLGHEVGLHYESSMWGSDKSKFNDEFTNDLHLLGKIVGKKIISAAQHNPIDSDFFNIEHLVQNEAYSTKIRGKFFYFSDSAMTWREHTPETILNQKDDIQFLAHPIWWMTESIKVDQKLMELALLNTNKYVENVATFQKYLEYCLVERKQMDQKFMKKRGI